MLDVSTGRVQKVGTGLGDYTGSTAVPHPYVGCGWEEGRVSLPPYPGLPVNVLSLDGRRLRVALPGPQ